MLLVLAIGYMLTFRGLMMLCGVAWPKISLGARAVWIATLIAFTPIYFLVTVWTIGVK